jgi:hypothetical protein
LLVVSVLLVFPEDEAQGLNPRIKGNLCPSFALVLPVLTICSLCFVQRMLADNSIDRTKDIPESEVFTGARAYAGKSVVMCGMVSGKHRLRENSMEESQIYPSTF